MDFAILAIFKTIGVMLLVLLNGFFVAAEFAIIKVRTTQLDALVNEGNSRAKMARHIVQHLDAYLSATQLGITIASLALGWIGEPFVASLLEPLFHYMGLEGRYAVPLLNWSFSAEQVRHGVSFGIGFTVITFLHIVFGELAPKSLAIQRAQVVTLWIAYPLHWFFFVFRIAINFLNGTANLFLRQIGIEPAKESELGHTEEELRLIVAESTKNEKVSDLSRSVIDNALDFKERVVRDVMIPRMSIVYLSSTNTMEENLEIAKQAQHSRFPLVRGTMDNVEGLILFKELFILSANEGDDANILSIRREIDFVPEMMSLERLLIRFQARRAHMVMVVDEFGSTVGIVTLENVLEELVGDIQDEFDQEASGISHVSEDEFLIDGGMPLHDFAEMVGLDVEGEGVSTVGGYVTFVFGYIPSIGETTTIENYACTVCKTDGRRVLLAHFKRIAGPTLPTVNILQEELQN